MILCQYWGSEKLFFTSRWILLRCQESRIFIVFTTSEGLDIKLQKVLYWAFKTFQSSGVLYYQPNKYLSIWRWFKNNISLQPSLLGSDQLLVLLTPYDVKRLELYSNNMADHHLVTDLLPALARYNSFHNKLRVYYSLSFTYFAQDILLIYQCIRTD